MFIAIEKRLHPLYIATIAAVLISLLAVAIENHYRHDAKDKSRNHSAEHMSLHP